MAVQNTRLVEKFGQVHGGLRFHVGHVDLTASSLCIGTPLAGMYAMYTSHSALADNTTKGHTGTVYQTDGTSIGNISICVANYDDTCVLDFVAVGW